MRLGHTFCDMLNEGDSLVVRPGVKLNGDFIMVLIKLPTQKFKIIPF